MRKMKEATILDYLDAGVPQAETAMRKLKEALVFKGFMDFPQQPLGSSAKLIPLTGAALESIGPGCYIGERCSVYTTIAYAVSNLLDRPTFTVGTSPSRHSRWTQRGSEAPQILYETSSRGVWGPTHCYVRGARQVCRDRFLAGLPGRRRCGGNHLPFVSQSCVVRWSAGVPSSRLL